MGRARRARPSAALLYSLVVSCTRVGANPVEYLTDVLHHVDRAADGDLADLLPHRCKPLPERGDSVDFDT